MSTSDTTHVKLQNIAIHFGSTVVHKNISLEIREGEVVTLMGPSGTGKTVLLKLIIGLLRPTSGRIIVLGSDITDSSEDEIELIRPNIGMLFQGAALFDSLSVYDNIAYPLRERDHISEDQISATVKEKLSFVGLSGFEAKLPPQLSGGQRKRIGLARALASNPKIILFDEPTTGLDPTSVRMIDDLIIYLKKELGITCVIVTHDMASAKRVSDRLILINNGEVIAAGATEQILLENELVNNFVTGNWEE